MQKDRVEDGQTAGRGPKKNKIANNIFINKATDLKMNFNRCVTC